jgi:hypothetical protein
LLAHPRRRLAFNASMAVLLVATGFAMVMS